MQYCELLHEWAWYFHSPRACENAVNEYNDHDMDANECNKMCNTEKCLVPSHTKYRVTNASILIKAHHGCQDTVYTQGPCNNTRTAQYRGIGNRKILLQKYQLDNKDCYEDKTWSVDATFWDTKSTTTHTATLQDSSCSTKLLTQG